MCYGTLCFHLSLKELHVMRLCSHSSDGSFFIKVVQKILQHIFLIASNLLCNSADRISRWLHYTIFIHNLHQLQELCASEKQGHLSLFCTRLDFVLAATFLLFK